MSLIYVFAASKMEGQPVQQISAARPDNNSTAGGAPSWIGVNEVVLITGGMGPKGARAKATAALDSASPTHSPHRPLNRKPDAVLVIGLCGGLTTSLPETRIVTYTDCLSTEPNKQPLRCSPSITKRLLELLVSRSIPCDSVVGITSPRIAITKDDKLALAKSGANAVDMESYEILAAAAEASVPVVVLRVVSDSLEREMPDFNRALNSEGALDGRKALKVALTAPIQTAQLLAANRRAMRHLAKALELVLPADCFSEAQA